MVGVVFLFLLLLLCELVGVAMLACHLLLEGQLSGLLLRQELLYLLHASGLHTRLPAAARGRYCTFALGVLRRTEWP